MPYTINGQEFQHGLITLEAQGGSGTLFPFSRFKSLKYKVGAEKAGVHDSQGKQVSYTIKEEKIEGSTSMLLSEWFAFRDLFLRPEAAFISAARGGIPVGIGQVAFDATAQYGRTYATLKTDRLLGVMIQEEPRDSSDNQEALVVEIPLFILAITDDQDVSFIQY